VGAALGRRPAVEAGIGAKRVAWTVIVALACGFCYSIGFQSGWSDATVRADRRLDQVTATLQEVTHEATDHGHAASAARLAAETTVATW
jgi:hypothetical protein